MFYILQFFYLIFNNIYDFFRYLIHSTTISNKDKPRLEARLMANAHVIEKGLSFPNRRFSFGKTIIKNLFNYMSQYVYYNYDRSNYAFQSSIRVLLDYEKFHHDNDVKVTYVSENLKGFKKYLSKNHKKSISTIDFNKIRSEFNKDFKNLSFSRHSIRHFSQKNVGLNIIKKAVKIAIQTPSVCNRQPWKVYFLSDKEKIQQALSFQSGNRGFGTKIPNLLIVTADLNAFQGFNERNQSYIDGGMFGMSLIYSMHYLGLATCILNWAVNFDTDIKIRKKISIPKNESIVFMVAAGYYPKKTLATSSSRKKVDEVLFYL